MSAGTKVAHTPGPWKVDTEDQQHVIRMGEALFSPAHFASHHAVEYRHGLYPDETSLPLREQWREAHANAHLIAAAPDLLEALGLLVGIVDSYGSLHGYASEKAHAAIAKARG